MRDSAHLSVLLIEDNADLAANISDYLESKGYLVDVAMDGVTGLHLAVAEPHHVVVLDLTLPGIDGLTLCRRLRQDARSTVPVLMLTARSGIDDKEAGYGEGADDYLTKPFVLRELDLRIQALVRRNRPELPGSRAAVGDLALDFDTLEVRRGERVISLPAIPLKILSLLIKRSPGVVPRREIEQAVWGDLPPDSDALRVHMHTLRSAIDRAGEIPLIHTMRGIGYQLKAPDVPPL